MAARAWCDRARHLQDGDYTLRDGGSTPAAAPQAMESEFQAKPPPQARHRSRSSPPAPEQVSPAVDDLAEPAGSVPEQSCTGCNEHSGTGVGRNPARPRSQRHLAPPGEVTGAVGCEAGARIGRRRPVPRAKSCWDGIGGPGLAPPRSMRGWRPGDEIGVRFARGKGSGCDYDEAANGFMIRAARAGGLVPATLPPRHRSTKRRIGVKKTPISPAATTRRRQSAATPSECTISRCSRRWRRTRRKHRARSNVPQAADRGTTTASSTQHPLCARHRRGADLASHQMVTLRRPV